MNMYMEELPIEKLFSSLQIHIHYIIFSWNTGIGTKIRYNLRKPLPPFDTMKRDNVDEKVKELTQQLQNHEDLYSAN